jgi:cysteine desulfurase
MKVAPDLARGAVRVSLGPNTTARQIQDFLLALEQTLFQLRRLTAVAV